MEIPISSIWFDRATRQRVDIETSDLEASIGKIGLINPVLVVAEPGPEGQAWKLIAGERRLTAVTALGWTNVPVRQFDDLSPQDQQIVELEENLKRKDLNWIDFVKAIAKIHILYVETNSGWNQTRTAEALSMSTTYVSDLLRVHAVIDEPWIAALGNHRAAVNALLKREARQTDLMLEQLMGREDAEEVYEISGTEPDGDDIPDDTAPAAAHEPTRQAVRDMPGTELTQASPAPSAPARQPTPRPAAPIQNLSFLDWAPSYRGDRFNLIHCDFPYGVNFNSGPLGAVGGKSNDMEAARSLSYDDSPDVYFELVRAFCEHRNNFMASAAHVVFWFSMTHYEWTKQYFAEHAPEISWNTFPLIWMKSDNRGIIPDPKRGPRQVYETALFGTRGDRHVLRGPGNAFHGPSEKAHHHSTKPQPMLEHFFSMLVDDTTSLLDPTCGGGSAIRAADKMGAARVLGLEISPEHHAEAVRAFNSHKGFNQFMQELGE